MRLRVKVSKTHVTLDGEVHACNTKIALARWEVERESPSSLHAGSLLYTVTNKSLPQTRWKVAADIQDYLWFSIDILWHTCSYHPTHAHKSKKSLQ